MQVFRSFRLYIVLLSVVISGCATNGTFITQSNVLSNYHHKIKKLSVVYVAKRLGSEESYIKKEDFNKLSIPFENAGVKTSLYFFSGMDLNARQHLNKLARKTKYVLIINPESMTTGDFSEVDYSVALYDASRNQKIWVASLSVLEGLTTTIFQQYDEMGSTIVKKLKADNLIN